MSQRPSQLRRLDDRSIPPPGREVRLLTVVRNESLRLPFMLRHYRDIGVDRFVVIDNGSDDGTLELLLEQPDVHVYQSEESFRVNRFQWKKELLDRHFDGCWTLVVDADELFVFPQMEQIALPELCRYLESEAVRGLHATMVDMYGEGAVDASARPEGCETLLEVCPYFDRGTYWLHFEPGYKWNRLDRAPRYTMRGGPRQRLFFQPETPPAAWRRALARWMYDIRRSRPPLCVHWRPLFKLLRSLATPVAPHHAPAQSKVPLVCWSRDMTVENASFHFVTPRVPLSACWGALLHFKYLPDFEERVAVAVSRQQHVDHSREYHFYQQRIEGESELVPFGSWSTRYDSTRSLLDAGLMRTSAAYESWVRGGARLKE